MHRKAVPESADVLHTELGHQNILFELADVLFGADAAWANCNPICVQVEVAAKPPEKAHQQLSKVCSLSGSLHNTAFVVLLDDVNNPKHQRACTRTGTHRQDMKVIVHPQQHMEHNVQSLQLLSTTGTSK